MKMQIYPSPEQKEKIDMFFRALHVAYNITFHEVFQLNPAVCTSPNKDGAVWPDYNKMAGKQWLSYLRECNSIIKEIPEAALSTNQGLFLHDAQVAWKSGMGNRPVNQAFRRDFHFYSAAKPRKSFMIQLEADKIAPSAENGKVAWIKLPKIDKPIKARGFNRKVWFGENGEHSYLEALEAGELAKLVTIRVSKDTCGDYFVSVTFSDGKKHDRMIFLESVKVDSPAPIGIDVGIKSVAIGSDGEKIENKHFKSDKERSLKRMNRQLSRRWGPANISFRDYNQDIRSKNKSDPTQFIPYAQPSRRYIKTQRNKAQLERKIARRRNTYYHQQTAKLVNKSSLIAVETLHIKNMFRNHKLAFALSDAAMSDFIEKLKYKAERRSVEIIPIGMWTPTSQICSKCGAQNPQVKNLAVRFWRCPQCGTTHDRDVNAAKNILAAALQNGKNDDPELAKEPKPRRANESRIRKDHRIISEDYPSIIVVYSKELTKPNNPRYIIIDKQTGETIDNAQGAGYRSISNAKNCFKAKKKHTFTA